MKHKTWFRLVLQAIGVLLIGLGLPDLIERVGSAIFWIEDEIYSAYGIGWSYIALHVSSPILQIAFGIYLLTGATWLLNKCIPSNRPYCPDCGYDLTATPNTAHCTECGVKLHGQSPSSGRSDQ